MGVEGFDVIFYDFRTFETVVEERVLKPLEMVQDGFIPQ